MVSRDDDHPLAAMLGPSTPMVIGIDYGRDELTVTAVYGYGMLNFVGEVGTIGGMIIRNPADLEAVKGEDGVYEVPQ